MWARPLVPPPERTRTTPPAEAADDREMVKRTASAAIIEGSLRNWSPSLQEMNFRITAMNLYLIRLGFSSQVISQVILRTKEEKKDIIQV
jgi:hypothetical protein